MGLLTDRYAGTGLCSTLHELGLMDCCEGFFIYPDDFCLLTFTHVTLSPLGGKHVKMFLDLVPFSSRPFNYSSRNFTTVSWQKVKRNTFSLTLMFKWRLNWLNPPCGTSWYYIIIQPGLADLQLHRKHILFIKSELLFSPLYSNERCS